MLRGERQAYRRGTATGHLSTRHDLTSFHASSSSLQGCPRVKHDDETADRNSVEEQEEEKEGEKDLSPSIRQSVGPPAKLRAIVVNRNRFLARFTPTPFQRSPSNGFVLLGLPFLPAISKRRPLESAENTLRPQHLDYANYDGLSSELGKRGRRSASTASTSHVATRRKRKFGLPLPRRPSRNSKPEGSRLRGISEFRMLGF